MSLWKILAETMPFPGIHHLAMENNPGSLMLTSRSLAVLDVRTLNPRFIWKTCWLLTHPDYQSISFESVWTHWRYIYIYIIYIIIYIYILWKSKVWYGLIWNIPLFFLVNHLSVQPCLRLQPIAKVFIILATRLLQSGCDDWTWKLQLWRAPIIDVW